MATTPSDLQNFFDETESAHVIVVGDLMLDRYLWGGVDRVSPEAPVPVVHLNRESDRAGGAANVAMNLAGLEVRTSLVGAVGTDDAARRLRDLLDQEGIGTEGLIPVSDRPTTTKTRVVGDRQQMLRIDDERVHPVEEEAARSIVDHVEACISDADVLLLSDYAKGVLSPEVCSELIRLANDASCPVLVDPKGSNYDKYAGADTVTPNDRELALATGAGAGQVEALLDAGDALRRRIDITNLIVTRGKDGISRVCDDGREDFPALQRDVFDVSGAGDTVVSLLAACRAARLDWPLSIRIANLAASVVIGKVGTMPIRRDELIDAVHNWQDVQISDKLYDADRIRQQVQAWRAQSETVVFTNGCFDILHAGHVTYLDEASRKGGRLVVGLNTDASVNALKGDPRPIMPQDERSRVLASLESVDAVVLFDEPTPADLIEAVRPDVLVKGADYEKSEVVGADMVKRWGGTVELIPLVEGVSTTNIVERVRNTSPRAEQSNRS